MTYYYYSTINMYRNLARRHIIIEYNDYITRDNDIIIVHGKEYYVRN